MSPCLLNATEILEKKGEAPASSGLTRYCVADAQVLLPCCSRQFGSSLVTSECLHLGTVWVLLIFKGRLLWH